MPQGDLSIQSFEFLQSFEWDFLTLELPSSWKYSAYWRNHAAVSPQQTGENRWIWELTGTREASGVEFLLIRMRWTSPVLPAEAGDSNPVRSAMLHNLAECVRDP